jgi:hypothetical protein
MVLYGIKVNKRILIYSIESLDFIIHIGEQNYKYNRDKYACSFSKLISYWREIWNERTNGITDIQFPFGFVQVSFISTSTDS